MKDLDWSDSFSIQERCQVLVFIKCLVIWWIKYNYNEQTWDLIIIYKVFLSNYIASY